VPEAEIVALKAGLERGLQAAPHPYLKVGRRVRITAGPLEGLEGIVIRKKNGLRVVVSLDLIQRSIRLDIEASLPRRCGRRASCQGWPKGSLRTVRSHNGI
jgi:transcription antitermination factor NusG